jgi:hypothetical protein
VKITQLLQQAEHLSVHERRRFCDDYAEFVVLADHAADWEKLFITHLGPPTKKAGINPSTEDQLLAQRFGGIGRGQTMFVKKEDEHVLLVMFWPWQDRLHITIKVILTTA